MRTEPRRASPRAKPGVSEPRPPPPRAQAGVPQPRRPSNSPPAAGAARDAVDPIAHLYARGQPDRQPLVPPPGQRVAPGVVSMSTSAQPGRYTYCLGEWAAQNPWESLAVEHGFAPTDSTVALLAADAPITVYDQRSRTAADLCATLAGTLAVIEHHKMTHWGDTLLVLSPAHAATIAGDGWSKADVRRFLFERLQ